MMAPPVVVCWFLNRMNLSLLQTLGGHKKITFLLLSVMVATILLAPLQFGYSSQESALTASVNITFADSEIDSVKGSDGAAAFGKTEAMFYNLLVTIGSWVLGFGGGLLERSLNTFVINMGGYMDNNGLTNAVDNLWKIVRDIFNLIFIFGIIYIGFRTILRVDETGTRRSLGLLIVAALLINFSLFTTKLVVDFSNLLAYEINRILVADTFDLGDAEVKTIAGKITKAVRLDQHSGDATEALPEISESDSLDLGDAIVMGLVTMIFMMVTGFVFAAGAILMIARFVALLVFMVFSPAIFLGWILPQFASKSREWWQQFLKYALMAPAYLFMIHLSFVVVDQINIDDGGLIGAVGSRDVTGANFGFLVTYLMVTGLMWASLVVAQKLGVFGADRVVGIGKSLAKTTGKYAKLAAGGAVSGGIAFAGQRSFGLLAKSFSENEGLRDRATSQGFKGTLARAQLATLGKVADASFDARRVGGVGKKLGVGEGRKGGYSSRLNESNKATVKYAEGLGYNSQRAKQIEEEYLPKIGAAKEQVAEKELALKNDDVVQEARKQIDILAIQLNAASSKEERGRLSEEVLAQREIISNRQEQIGVDSAKKDLQTLTQERDSKITAVKKERAENYAKTVEGSRNPLFRHQNKADAGAIRKKVNKDKNDEILDKIESLSEKVEKDKSS